MGGVVGRGGGAPTLLLLLPLLLLLLLLLLIDVIIHVPVCRVTVHQAEAELGLRRLVLTSRTGQASAYCFFEGLANLGSRA